MLALIPDTVFFFSYLVLVWQLFKLFFEGHAELATDIERRKAFGAKLLVTI